MSGTYPGPIPPLSDVLPGLRERPGGIPALGAQRIVSVPLWEKTVVDTTSRKVGVWTAPSDGWYVVDVFVSQVVLPAYTGVATLALDNYDKSAAAARNLLSTTTIDLKAAGGFTALKGLQLTLSATLANRMLDEGDFINANIVIGATEATAGEGIALTLVVQGPEINPQ